MYGVQVLRQRVVDNCPVCSGRNRECSCWKVYRILVSMLMNNFPEEHVYRLEKKDSIEVRFDNEDDKSYFDYAVENYKEFIEEGLGLVFYEGGVSLAASLLVYSIMENRYSLGCRFVGSVERDIEKLDLEADIVVVDSIDKIQRMIVEAFLGERRRRVGSCLVCIPYMDILDDWPELAEALGWSGSGFDGEIFRGVKVEVSKGASRWLGKV